MKHVGKLGIVRLTGKDLQALRRARFEFDDYRCQCSPNCGVAVTWESGDLAHIKSRGAGGSDTLDNTRTMLHEHHMRSHNAGGRPLPRKAR
jgi:hypothetical protein